MNFKANLLILLSKGVECFETYKHTNGISVSPFFHSEWSFQYVTLRTPHTKLLKKITFKIDFRCKFFIVDDFLALKDNSYPRKQLLIIARSALKKRLHLVHFLSIFNKKTYVFQFSFYGFMFFTVKNRPKIVDPIDSQKQ